MTSFLTPKDTVNFDLKKRYNFIPKGLSPLLKETKVLNVSLSPNSKLNLHRKLFENMEKELEIIKWDNYLKSEDPKEFFQNMYRLKNKQIEKMIPNVCKENLPRNLIRLYNDATLYNKSDTNAFSKDIFEELRIVGPLDCKFIVAFADVKKMVFLFDQHAVHERIRVEQLMKGFYVYVYSHLHFYFRHYFSV